MRFRLFLAMSAVIAVVVGLTVVAYDRLDIGGDGGDQIVSGPGGTVADTTTTAGGGDPSVVLRPGQVRVRGAVTAVELTDAVLDPREVPTPLTISSARGFGNGGELTGVVVDGEPSSIVWDGGRPFVLASAGALVLDPVALTLVPDGLRAVLGDGNHALAPGTYRLDTPVAVGRAGIATPRDSVTFGAVEGSLFEARGDASLVFAPDADRRFVGPGRVAITGSLELTDAGGTRAATELHPDGPVAFDLTFRPDGAGGWVVEGIVQGAISP